MPAAHFPLRPEDEPAPALDPGLPADLRLPVVAAVAAPARRLPRLPPARDLRGLDELAGGRNAYSELCLACSRATREYIWPRDGMREAPISGGDWSPPCVAVARLRRAVFSPPLE